MRPLSLQHVVLTFVIPLIPLCYAWDGKTSAPRIYTPADLEALRDRLDDGYRWEEGPAKGPDGKARGRYLLGLPA